MHIFKSLKNFTFIFYPQTVIGFFYFFIIIFFFYDNYKILLLVNLILLTKFDHNLK